MSQYIHLVTTDPLARILSFGQLAQQLVRLCREHPELVEAYLWLVASMSWGGRILARHEPEGRDLEALDRYLDGETHRIIDDNPRARQLIRLERAGRSGLVPLGGA